MSVLATNAYPQVLGVITLLSQGRTLTEACDECRITFSSFRAYVNAVPELTALFTDAEQRGYDVMADALLNIFDPGNKYGETEPKRAKIISDNIKWYLARKRPALYGDKSIVEHQITADKTIVEALSRGKDTVSKAVLEDVTYRVVEDVVPVQLPPGLQQFA
jgi:hypothetical protein